MQVEDIRVGQRIVLQEDMALNLVEVLSIEQQPRDHDVYWTWYVRNLRQIRRHIFGYKLYGEEYSVGCALPRLYACWQPLSLDEARTLPGFQESWLTEEQVN